MVQSTGMLWALPLLLCLLSWKALACRWKCAELRFHKFAEIYMCSPFPTGGVVALLFSQRNETIRAFPFKSNCVWRISQTQTRTHLLEYTSQSAAISTEIPNKPQKWIECKYGIRSQHCGHTHFCGFLPTYKNRNLISVHRPMCESQASSPPKIKTIHMSRSAKPYRVADMTNGTANENVVLELNAPCDRYIH